MTKQPSTRKSIEPSKDFFSTSSIMHLATLLFSALATLGFYANALPVEPKRDAAAKSEASPGPAPGFKPVIVWEHTTSDDDDGMVYQWRRNE
ncbi:hypothetical protein TW65_04979 [Stemphylium lycopersici]|uniref:Uncharacterized protein n=1 Tax=Stemphylium lycopersici TaxID=183478 RepID=A0A364MUK0_STELY|nr:hypothetical protein TW65_04979 [Stemphylium lycopersici]RAR03739.1 hypothetical protein DDE83_008110 [Stemphylium lycopersici]